MTGARKPAKIGQNSPAFSVKLKPALTSGDLGMVKMLLEGGADVNAKDNNGKTAFDYALDKEIKELLLKYMPNADGIEKQ